MGTSFLFLYFTFVHRFVEVPGGVNRNNYANVNLIIELAKSQGVDAVWPGWGHASENPKLPNGLKQEGESILQKFSYCFWNPLNVSEKSGLGNRIERWFPKVGGILGGNLSV